MVRKDLFSILTFIVRDSVNNTSGIIPEAKAETGILKALIYL